MSDLITAIQKAIADICAARLCEVNSMSSRQEMLRLMIQATDTLRAALAQQEQKQEPVAFADRISFDQAMKSGKGHDVWPEAGDYVARTGRKLRVLYTHPPRRETERESGGVCGQCGGWVCDPVVRPGHITVGMPPCEVRRPEPRRLTDDEIGRIWFQAKIPGLTETNARLLIRAAERFVRAEQGVADPVATR